ncbi:NAD(P)-dependent oxidoreductase [Frigoribacterium sp. Leaf172]|uniref:NAD(P)-dependent oxidoreductase n=1 Tax=Frigoribacterium sp. Leaf172 TaxID=1736285 RepID=UPI0006F52AB5|nr:NAD(P)-binding oxidoreductase [Frigoribacterium sp. Leaf172]KQR66192.1 hypothetical protein ASF89_03375 [Frigoribacterium sp. Leaf172]
MKVLLLGATGGVGSHLLRASVAAGHDVRVLVRDATALETSDEVDVVVGDATTPSHMAEAVAGRDVVLNAVGSRNFRMPVELEVGRVLLPALAEAGVGRLIVCSAFGVGDSQRDAGAMQKMFFHSVLGRVYAAKEVADAEVRASDLDWTLVYPTRLTDGPATGDLVVAERLPAGASTKVARADVARFMMAQLGDDTWSRRTAVVTGSQG